MRRLPSTQRNSPIARERDRQALSRMAWLLFCGLVLAGGFVYAAGQHFAAVDYGYRSEKLRREHAELLEEQRRLMLERDEAASLVQLEREAQKLGMQPLQSGQVGGRKSEGQLPPTASALIAPSATLNR